MIYPFLEKYRLFRHILFWSCYLVFMTLVYGVYRPSYTSMLEEKLIDLPVILGATYSMLYFIVPRYLLTKRYGKFVLWLLPTVIFFGYAQLCITYYFKYPFVYGKPINYCMIFCTTKAIAIMIDIYSVVAVAMSIKLFLIWYKNEQAREKLHREKLHAELNHLKAQLHPHFLFNTLNNIYSLAINKSDKVPDVIIKLSEILDFMLHECNERLIPLSHEIKLVTNYIELEKLRYGAKLKIETDFPENVHHLCIAPLLIMPLVENSFKHGASTLREHPYIRMNLTIREDKVIVFHIENNVDVNSGKDEQEYRKGIGLKNLKRRLELLYHDNYELSIEQRPDRFSVSLRINLQSHCGDLP